MPRTPEQFEKLREEKRRQIMDAALELFANEGYHSTSISNIAMQAGISKGLMYNYFESKEELVSSIIDSGIEIMEDLFDPNNDGVLTTDEFDFFVNRSFDALAENLSYWKLYFGIMMQPLVFEIVREKYHKIIEGTLGLLVEYYKKQGVEDPESEAFLFGALMDGISMNYILNPDIFPLEKIKKTIIERFGHKD
ncbi:MAG: TetR/AcrR family transcriptional regulator [Bacteroidetes bacterium]|nr:TetR/AcrR family transcriptional regulator [Bacteroidota bacterium]